MLVLRRVGVTLAGLGLDPMVGDYLLDAGARTHGLDALADKYLRHPMIPISELIGTGQKQLKMFEVDVAKAAEYAAEDAQVTFELADVVHERLKAEGLAELYWNLERPLIGVLAEMEFAGIRVDVDELKRQSDELTHRLAGLVKRDLRRGAGPNSTSTRPSSSAASCSSSSSSRSSSEQKPARAPTRTCWNASLRSTPCRPASSSIGRCRSSRGRTSTPCRRW